MQGDIVTYDYFGGLYINMTNRCDCHCVFCIRDQEASALGGLWLQEEPAKEAVLAEILAQDLANIPRSSSAAMGSPPAGRTICFGSATSSGPPDGPTCPHPPEHQRPRQPHQPPGHHPGTERPPGRGFRLSQRVEPGGVSPPHPSRRREKGWQAMLDFVRHAVQYVPKVMVSIVDYDKSPQEMEACRRLAEELGATFRVRPFAG